MATDRKALDDQSTTEERTEQLRQAIARREAVQTLDTFQLAGATGAAVEAGSAIGDAAVDLSSPGFGETDSTEITGDASIDQDVHDAAGDDVENEELAGGQNALADFRNAKEAAVNELGSPDDDGHKPPVLDQRSSLIGGSGTEQASGGGGGENQVSSGSGIEGRGFAEGLATGSDSVAAAGGPQADVGGLLGNPRDLVQRGAGNSAASDSDAAHSALAALTEEEGKETMDKTSIAGDAADAAVGTGVAVGSVVAANAVVATAEIVGGISVAGALGVVALGVAGVGAAGIAGVAVGSLIEEEVGDIIHGVPSDAETEYKATLGRIAGEERKKAKGGGVGDPGNPDDPQNYPPTEAEQALRAATNKLIGRNDALVHGPATQINPGDQGEVFQTDGTPLASSAERAQGLFGTPKEEGSGNAPAPDLGQTAPSLGPDGTEILVEDGNPFTGGQRTEGPEDVQFGRVEPLVGLDGGTGGDSLPPEEEDSGKDIGRKSSAFDLFDND